MEQIYSEFLAGAECQLSEEPCDYEVSIERLSLISANQNRLGFVSCGDIEVKGTYYGFF